MDRTLIQEILEVVEQAGIASAKLTGMGLKNEADAAAVEAMREALLAFDKQVPGFARPDALMTGVETRTSSPIRIPRGFDFQSVNTAGLFPAGEGAGYAGGILSAGVDGIRVAEALALTLTGQPIPRDMSRGAESSMTYG